MPSASTIVSYTRLAVVRDPTQDVNFATLL